MSENLLEVMDFSSGYGKLRVLWEICLEVSAGETVVLLGPNGAGKSTLIKGLMGLLPTWGGHVKLAGRDISAKSTDRRVRAGISYMSEIGCFMDLSVLDNLRVGTQFLPAMQAKQEIDSLLERFPTLQEKRKALAGSLSGGQRKILGVAKALASRPKLLIMDEPSAGLSPLFVSEVIQALRSLRISGMSLLIAEQNIKFLEIADRVYTLEGGRIGFSGTVSEMHSNSALERAYFGLHA